MNEAQTKHIIPVHQIVAMDEENGIGIGGNLPWNLPKDWNHFLHMTTKVKDDEHPYACWILSRVSFEKHAKKGGLFEEIEREKQIKLIVIVMSNTWKNIPETYHQRNDTYLCSNFLEVLKLLRLPEFTERLDLAWNLGGPGIYHEQLEYLHARLPEEVDIFRVYMTKVYKMFGCDVFYPIKTWNKVKDNFVELSVCDDIPMLQKKVVDEENVSISFHVYELNKYLS